MIDIRLKVFRSVAHNLSFTAAAKELFISQPAISKHVQELENEYHTQLFNRMGNSITLTPAGELLLRHSEKIAMDYAKMDFEMNALRQKFSGELRIGASTTIAQYVLPEILAAFIKRYPHIQVTTVSGNSRDVEAALLDGKIDIGMVEGLIRLPQIKYNAFMKDELVAIVDKDNPLAGRNEVSLDELRHIPLVLRERGSGSLDIIEDSFRCRKISLADLNVVMFLGTTEGIKRFVEKSGCMGIVSVRSVSKELLMGYYKLIDIADVSLERQFAFAERRGEQGEMQRMFKQFITSSYHR
jgi:LysR family transcriptional regulator, transcriptional activator of the cysJI operon